MIFENLSDKLQNAFAKLKGRGRLSKEDIKLAMRDVKLALLEADVNFRIVREFINSVTEKASQEEVMRSLTPEQQVIKIVNDELCALMGSTNSKIEFSSSLPSMILMAGLQGAGKTTASAKLASYLKKKGKKPMMVACDIYRPAAIKQLQVLGGKIDIPVFTIDGERDVIKIVEGAIERANYFQNDVLIIDTAGRLHIDEDMMAEITSIKQKFSPREILLVLDAMTGQDAVNVAESFNSALEISGIIMSKLDGDTRGGAALSVKAVTGKPIKFASVGEKIEDLQEFHPDRMASQILGMGDMLTLIEKAQESFDMKSAEKLEKKIKSSNFDLEDFLEQLEQIQNMGPIGDILSMIPGLNKKMLANANVDDKQIIKTKAIIQSMTMQERKDPSILAASRKRRIAAGAGMHVSDINRLLKQFDQTKKLMKRFNGKKKFGKRGLPF